MHERFANAYDPFVIPYMIGFVFIIIYILIAIGSTFKNLPISDKKKMLKHLISYKIFITIKDIILDCLLHIKIWKKNMVLGYMHSSIAIGWFMLILIGHIEIFFYAPHRINVPYYPIFFRYFMMETETTVGGGIFFFLMDLFLLMVLSGIVLAMIKRIRRKMFGMKRTTKLKWNDQIAVYSLWCIFPLRFLAESFTSGISGGGFLTRSFGMVFDWFHNFMNNEALIRPTWWAYSIALMLFFLTLPWSRFTHILAEVLLIYMRNAGIRESNKNNGYASVEIYSCSRCGICLDPCQLVSSASLRAMSSIDFTRNTRLYRRDQALQGASTCMMCNRCVQACPVGVNSVQIKLNTKTSAINYLYPKRYDYVDIKENIKLVNNKYDVVYFAGCMSHLTPSIEHAMEKILSSAGDKFLFIDKEGGICCGRPMLLAGDKDGATQMIAKNTDKIISSGAKKMVCSCPICYKVFKDMYKLQGIEVLHHSEYILNLIEEGRIAVIKRKLPSVFHDPCELGRNSGIYEQPREILRRALMLKPTDFDGKDSLCCGHSIAAEALPYKKKRVIAKDALHKMVDNEQTILVTACPSCKKAFVEVGSGTQIKDIAEIVSEQLVETVKR